MRGSSSEGEVVTEYPILCVNPGCRPEQHGGPRRTNRANLCDVCHDRFRENLGHIADAWGDLIDQLARDGGSGMQERVKGTPDRGLILNEQASDAMRDATSWAWFLARVIEDEKRPARGPATTALPDVLRWVAWHVDHFAKHSDADLAGAVADEAYEHLRAVRKAAYPSGARRIDLGIRCKEVTLDDDGQQHSCSGTMFAVIVPQAGKEPDLICAEDETHRIEPPQWRRIGWRRRAHPAGVENLVRKLAG